MGSLGTILGGVGGFLVGGPVGAVIGAGLGSSMGSDPGQQAAQASQAAGAQAAAGQVQGAEIQAQYQREALDYLKEREAVPRAASEGALSQLAGMSGIEGGQGDQQAIIERAISSPLYGAIMGGREAGEDAILRSASATGGLRSGNVQHNLYDYNVQLENRALLESYNQQMSGLQGLAGLPSNANQIAQQTSGIGSTLGLGYAGAAQTQAQAGIAGAQAIQTGQQQQMGNMMGLGSLGIAAYGAGMFSDRRLKTNIKYIGQEGQWNIYSWAWNKVANKMGLTGTTVGCMADEVYPVRPDAVVIKDCFMFVLYDKIGILPGV